MKTARTILGIVVTVISISSFFKVVSYNGWQFPVILGALLGVIIINAIVWGLISMFNKPKRKKKSSINWIECGKEITNSSKSCPHCGREISSDSKFCSHCGKEIPIIPKSCSNCGTQMPDNSKFCFHCGHKQIEEDSLLEDPLLNEKIAEVVIKDEISSTSQVDESITGLIIGAIFGLFMGLFIGAIIGVIIMENTGRKDIVSGCTAAGAVIGAVICAAIGGICSETKKEE
jgi:Primosomal protein N'' (replication factor Y) - superfamily II helicase